MNNMRIFQNGIIIVNTTPHPLTIHDMDGSLVTIPSDPEFVLNATCVELDILPRFKIMGFLRSRRDHSAL